MGKQFYGTIIPCTMQSTDLKRLCFGMLWLHRSDKYNLMKSCEA